MEDYVFKTACDSPSEKPKEHCVSPPPGKTCLPLKPGGKCAAGRHLRFRALPARAVFVHSLSRNARVGAERLARREGTGHPNRRSSERPGLDVDIECAQA